MSILLGGISSGELGGIPSGRHPARSGGPFILDETNQALDDFRERARLQQVALVCDKNALVCKELR